MKRRSGLKLMSVITAAAIMLSLLAGCGAGNAQKGDSDAVTVYMWSTQLYDSYALYVQSQLPDVDIEFVVGNNDLDFYKFIGEHGTLPDIITCRRFSLHDAAGLKDQLLDLSTTEAAGAVYDSYLANFTNPDGTVNWLPLCGEVDGLVANRGLFEQYNIPLPTDYESFISACEAFEAKGIRGFVADFAYDYTCMEILQALSIPELTSLDGRMWRSGYEAPSNMDIIGLDDKIWPEAFARMEQFIRDVKLQPEDLELDYTPVIDMFTEGRAAVIRAGGWNVNEFQKNGLDAVFLPYFGSGGEQWLLTYPQFQVALSSALEEDRERKEKAVQVLNVMLSEEAQNILSMGGDVISYSQNVDLALSSNLDNLKPLIDQNHMYIRIASNAFFAVSKDVVSKMITGEYSAAEAYEAFDSRLREPEAGDSQVILSVDQSCSNRFRSDGGNASYSVMANSIRTLYGSDVLLAPAYSFTGTVLKADYTEKMTGNMVMPNALQAWHREMSGGELKELVRAYTEGIQGGFTPFNRGSLPVCSGITMEVSEQDGAYTLKRVLRDGAEIADSDTFRVTCLNTQAYMSPFLQDETRAFAPAEERVRTDWTAYIRDGGALAKPENYITLK